MSKTANTKNTSRSALVNARDILYLSLAALTVLCYSILYAPIQQGWLVWVTLVPWLIVVVICPLRRQLLITYLAGLAFFFISVYWVLPVTIPGYVSLGLFLALYWLLAGLAIQRLVCRYRWPAFLAVPIIVVGCDYLRSIVITGFPWFYLGHSQVSYLSVIQIADIFGVYGVTFVAAMVNGLIVDGIERIRSRRGTRSLLVGTVSTAVVVVVTLVYGHYRLGQETTYAGPRLGVVQEDFPMTVERGGPDEFKSLTAHMHLSRQAARQRPAMIIWPETSLGFSVNQEFLEPDLPDYKTEQTYSRDVTTVLANHARRAKAYLITGSISQHVNPPGTYPTVDRYNSAILLDPQGRPAGRYDKIHLVLFGEYVPFRYTFPRLYRFLNENMTPYGEGGYEYSLTHGTELERFKMNADGQTYRFSVAICYEDTMAYLIRRFVAPVAGQKQIDFLVNISNDGWFDHSSELRQHLHICVFRAVENRIGIARAVNTGMSGFISPTGRIEQLVTSAGRANGPGVRGQLVRRVTLDHRVSLYSRFGDWFALLCLITTLAVVINVQSHLAWLAKKLGMGTKGRT